MCANYTCYTSSLALNNAQVLHSGGEMGGKSVHFFILSVISKFLSFIYNVDFPDRNSRNIPPHQSNDQEMTQNVIFADNYCIFRPSFQEFDYGKRHPEVHLKSSKFCPRKGELS